MVLIISNSQDVTVDYLLPLLDEAEVPYLRFDTDRILEGAEFTYRLSLPALHWQGHSFEPQSFTNVWYRRPQRLKMPAQVNGSDDDYLLDEWSEAIEGFLAHIPKFRWVNHPSANALASNKLEQLTTASRMGLTVPKTLVTQDPERLREFFFECAERIIAKPMSSGLLERSDSDQVSLIYTSQVTKADLENLDDLRNCPTLFQEHVQKTLDIRVTIIDQDVHSVSLAAGAEGVQRCDIRRDNMEDVIYQPCALPDHIRTKLLALMEYYRLRFAAIDLAITENGEWVYFETNPNGQWAWLDLSGGMRIGESFVRAFAQQNPSS